MKLGPIFAATVDSHFDTNIKQGQVAAVHTVVVVAVLDITVESIEEAADTATQDSLEVTISTVEPGRDQRWGYLTDISWISIAAFG